MIKQEMVQGITASIPKGEVPPRNGPAQAPALVLHTPHTARVTATATTAAAAVRRAYVTSIVVNTTVKETIPRNRAHDYCY